MVELVNEVGVTLINVSATDEMVAMAAWVSHDADKEERLHEVDRIRKLIHFLYKNKHMSPFEHGVFTFKIDAPLFVAREFFRHRTASYNEVSGRYTVMQPRFYAGDTARQQEGKPGAYYFVEGTSEQTAILRQSKRKLVKKAWEVYEQRLDAGIAKEQAREELPLSLMTQWYVTMNPRNLMQFLTLRNEKTALKEIQDVAVKMEAIFAEHMPLTYAAYVAGREAYAFDADAARKQIAQLESDVSIWKGTAEARNKIILDLEREVKALQLEKANVEAQLFDVNSKYNAAFVAKEQAKQDEDYQTGGFVPPTADKPKIDNSYIIPKGVFEQIQNLAKIQQQLSETVDPKVVEKANNIVVQVLQNGKMEEIAASVVKAMKEAEKRRGR